MQLFPSRSQLHEMLHCAEECFEISSVTCIMFGEFCIFATELERLCERGVPVPMSANLSVHCDGKDINFKTNSKRMASEVFLGGSCNPTTWRSDVAIPTLQRLGITYYNPQVSQWGPELIAQEYEAKQAARVLLFVIDNQTRNTAGIIEAAQLAATRSNSLILVIYPYRPDQSILGENVSMQEYYDLMNGLLVLQNLVERQRIPIFGNISIALNCTSKILRDAINVQDLNVEDGIRPLRLGTDLIKLNEIFRSMDVNNTGTVSLGEAWIALQSNTKSNVSVADSLNAIHNSDVYETLIANFSTRDDPAEYQINFEQFCAVATEWAWKLKNNSVASESISCSNSLLLTGWPSTLIPESENRDIFVGVTGKDIFWLNSTAAPLIKSMDLSVYKADLNEYDVRILSQQLQHMKASRLILLIVPPHSRGISIMALAAHFIGLRSKLVLCIQSLPDDCTISGEKLTQQAIKDYNRGRMYLSDYATREGVPVFQNIADALQHAIEEVQRR
ncbi:uncharacterized protein LOC124299281 isoform X4 [Neodiprion virginianus]|uniref:Uncharacterized protein LOC107221700 isoform X4 n=1 Tax=Neodiprion lecontei TaxID=441921 RepID=A0ABM3FJ11_NEOLC|nr:uncharacterized protein LOC124176613 isoform X4 [Neodiprion fabricii]XP_046588014.1 uncharacterized protein LOC107221700 isoform X4 [Neodiprion lecontei]XP_046608348.1 uncharacterized protein LOC124299281 isoform X4 [Neodiprion virginianus]